MTNYIKKNFTNLIVNIHYTLPNIESCLGNKIYIDEPNKYLFLDVIIFEINLAPKEANY